MKSIPEILKPFYKKLGTVEYYYEPKTVHNSFLLCAIHNCIAYIEVLGLGSGAGDIFYALKQNGYNVSVIGLDIYILSENQKP